MILGPVNILLQSKDLDLLAAMNSIHNAQLLINNLRSTNIFNKIVTEVSNFEKQHGQFEFSDKLEHRIRRKKKMSGEESSDELILDPIENFKVNTFYVCLDIISSAFEEYFGNSSIGIYKDLALFSKKRLAEVKINFDSLPKDSFAMFCKIYGKYVNQEKLKMEYIHFSKIFNSFEENVNLPKCLHRKDFIIEQESQMSDSETETDKDYRKPLNVGSMKTLFDIFHAGNLSSVFPTLNTALQIALTLPVSSATTERTFSKLKIIKSRLRTTMTNTRLEDLMIITCEQDLYKGSDRVMELFASKSTELSKLLI